MEINIGDRVRYLNTSGGGVVKAFHPDGKVVILDDATEMELPVARGECVVVSGIAGMQQGMKMHYTGGVGAKVNADVTKGRKPKPVEPRITASTGTLEVDLHIEKLSQSRNLSDAACLNLQIERCRRTLTEHRQQKGLKIIFIHGKGDGTLRLQIMKLLMSEFPTCKASDASFSKYGMYGATEVII